MTKSILGAYAATVAPAALALLQTACGGGGGSQAPAGSDVITGSSGSRRDSGSLLDTGVPPTDAGLADSSQTTTGQDGSQIANPDASPDAASRSDAAVGPMALSCPVTHTWAPGRDWIQDPIARFGGVASAGLTVAWTRTDGSVAVADRATETSSFQPVNIAPMEQLQADARLALDPGGTLLLGVAQSGSSFAMLQRPNTKMLWKSASPAAFGAISDAVAQAGATMSEPVLAASGDAFFYLVTPAAGAPAIYESTLDTSTGQWKAGVALPNPELASTDATHRRRPTGASSDDRTLFFFDEMAQVERAAWRDDPASPFHTFQDIAIAPEAAPNGECSLLYFKAHDSAGTEGIFVAF
jgi:hypothetical protein